MKKTVKRLTAVILAVMVMLSCSMTAWAGDPGWIEEITATEADEKYNSGEKCIIFFYQDGCYNCYNIETNVISYWLEYGTIVYAVNLPVEGWPVFLNKEYYGQTITTPIVAFVNGSCTSYYMGATSFDVLNNAFYDFYDITPSVSATGVNISQTSASLEIGDTLQLSATVSPSTANQSVTWSSSNTSVATVSSSGYVTAKASGSAYITATTADGSYSASCYVSVSECEASLESISIRTKPNKTTYTVGESFNSSGLSLTAKYSDGSTKVITSGFTCTEPDMTTAGTKSVTVTYQGKTASFDITVKEAIVKADSVKIIVEKDFNNTDVCDLGVEIGPSNAEYSGVLWRSTDTSIATVDQNGVVTTKGVPGETQIIVTVYNYDKTFVMDVITVTVERPENQWTRTEDLFASMFDLFGAIIDLLIYPFVCLIDFFSIFSRI